MTRTILTAAAALALALPGAASADGHAASPFAEPSVEYGQSYRATTLLGTRVHAVEVELDPTVPLPAGTVAEWDDIGEIGDMIIGVDGSLEAVIVDVGGFLGLGEKEVALNWSALRGVREDDDPEEYFLGVNLTQEMLEAAPEVERVPAN
ncbi:PRC-barrel domain-containing protein [Jannaschia sp. Os4]|uniref:PRC-barrel domain-containing protein n=1 Tax=Jannaschia sp. Os4 TaxID=2807617 RepID=UPI00193ADA00|nr:PRC-barrel domain-containing protein [Jannaschia sp. Os4]MBM2575271.1 PRC-barrel domain-containing protein [Jannaschia sp. Os4]